MLIFSVLWCNQKSSVLEVIYLASRIDKLIDQAEATNESIRNLTALILPLLTATAPPPVKKAVAIAPAVNDELAALYFTALRGVADVAQNPTVGQSFIDAARPRVIPTVSTPKVRSAAQKKVAKMQSTAFKEANSKLRNRNGSLKKGKTQRDVAVRAQKILKQMKRGPNRSRKASPSTRGKRTQGPLPSRKPRGRRGSGRR